MPRRRAGRNVFWRSGQVLNHDGYEYGEDMDGERQLLIWDFDPQEYYLTFPADPNMFFYMPRQPLYAWWLGTTLNHDADMRESLRLHFMAGYYEDHAGRQYPLWWCCELLLAYCRI